MGRQRRIERTWGFNAFGEIVSFWQHSKIHLRVIGITLRVNERSLRGLSDMLARGPSPPTWYPIDDPKAIPWLTHSRESCSAMEESKLLKDTLILVVVTQHYIMRIEHESSSPYCENKRTSIEYRTHKVRIERTNVPRSNIEFIKSVSEEQTYLDRTSNSYKSSNTSFSPERLSSTEPPNR